MRLPFLLSFLLDYLVVAEGRSGLHYEAVRTSLEIVIALVLVNLNVKSVLLLSHLDHHKAFKHYFLL